MSGLGDSKWVSKPTSSVSGPASNGKPEKPSRQISVPPFGHAIPNGSPGNLPPIPSGAKPTSGSASKTTPPQPDVKPLSRAEIAGKAAAKRMADLQGDSSMSNKPYLHQNYGYLAPDPTFAIHHPVTPSEPRLPPLSPRPAAETAEQKRVRLHKLFNIWVPRADEFYNAYTTLDLTAEELRAIQDEILSYRVNSTMAASKRTLYRADWETASACLPPRRRAEIATGGVVEDPFDLDLPTATKPAWRGGAVKRTDLFD